MSIDYDEVEYLKELKHGETKPYVDPDKYVEIFGIHWTNKFVYTMVFIAVFAICGLASCWLNSFISPTEADSLPRMAVPAGITISTPAPPVRNITMGDGSIYCETGCEITNQTIINPAPTSTPVPSPLQCQLIQDFNAMVYNYNEVPIYDPNSPSWFMEDIPGWPIGAVTQASGPLDIHGISEDGQFLLITIGGLGQGWTPYTVSVDIDPPGCQPPVLLNPFPDVCILRLRASFGFFNPKGKPLFWRNCTE